MDCEHFKARLEAVQADSLREKKEKLALRQQLQEARQQLQQQAEYCTEMGAAACTLLWGVSSREEVVTAILGGDKALKFFSITGQTMESFVKSLDGDVREPDSDENQFVFALAGIVTNVAAIACGREFLVNSSRVLLDTMLQLLGDLKPGQCTKLKVLLLMALYNVSINLKGLRYISESPGFIPLLWWLLSGWQPLHLTRRERLWLLLLSTFASKDECSLCPAIWRWLRALEQASHAHLHRHRPDPAASQWWCRRVNQSPRCKAPLRPAPSLLRDPQQAGGKPCRCSLFSTDLSPSELRS
ncbi:heat shock factor 2-binding protein isoform X3 [Pteropus medius]|nr:heat shock factor 2-binding protein isoform X3 [Pteropus giganteus]